MSASEEPGFAIAVSNPLLGVFNYIVLRLPIGWRVKSGDFPSEVYSSTKKDDIRWVTEGEATHYVYSDERREALRLTIHITGKPRKLRRDKKRATVTHQGISSIHGHAADYVIGHIRRGFFKPKTYDYLQMASYCDITGRNIELRLEGSCSSESLKTLVTKLQLAQCH